MATVKYIQAIINGRKSWIQLPEPGELTPEQLIQIAEHIDLSGKVDKVYGKGLSTNDYTNEDKQKVAEGTGGSGNIDGGRADTNYGSQDKIDGGSA